MDLRIEGARIQKIVFIAEKYISPWYNYTTATIYSSQFISNTSDYHWLLVCKNWCLCFSTIGPLSIIFFKSCVKSSVLNAPNVYASFISLRLEADILSL